MIALQQNGQRYQLLARDEIQLENNKFKQFEEFLLNLCALQMNFLRKLAKGVLRLQNEVVGVVRVIDT
jgi:hypothetical protein